MPIAPFDLQDGTKKHGEIQKESQTGQFNRQGNHRQVSHARNTNKAATGDNRIATEQHRQGIYLRKQYTPSHQRLEKPASCL